MNKFKKAAVLAASLVAMAGAQAAVVTQTAALVLQTTEISQSFSFAAFDSKLGTLTGVSVALDGKATSSASIDNHSSGDAMFSFSSTLSLFLDGAGVSDQLDFTLFDYKRQLTPLGITSLGTTDVSGSSKVDPTDLAAFAGPVTFTCQSAVGTSAIGGGGNITVPQETVAGCGVTLTYTYTAAVTPPPAVPEPASLALVGLALAGVAASRRRKV